MRFEFSAHARQRCRERKIRYRDVKSVIENPTRTAVSPSGAIESRKKVKDRTLVVIFEVHKEVRTIITAYYED